jgi:hypothetical protein
VPKENGGLRSGANRAADSAAISLSLLCLVHCLMLPLMIASFPALAGLLDIPEFAHLLLFFLAVPISSIAIVAGYRRHGFVLPGAIAAIGLVLIGTGALAGFAVMLEVSITVAGSLLVALAHVSNWRIGKRRNAERCAG